MGRAARGGGQAPLPLATALRASLGSGYDPSALRSDLFAGLVVGIVALPLSMALAIATGMPPQHGLYTAIAAGLVIALLGGSRVQVSGPTAAFVVVLLPIREQFGPGGLVLASFLAGGVLLVMGLARLGRLVEFIPYPVTTGFTAGIAVVIASLQVKDFLGLSLAGAPEHFAERVVALAGALPTCAWPEALVGGVTLFVLLAWPRVSTRVPSPLIAVLLGAGVAGLLERFVPGVEIQTIARRFHYEVDGVVHGGIPRGLPEFHWPWDLPGADGQPIGLSYGVLRALLPSAITIAALGAIESLLSAVIADGMSGSEHHPDGELLGQAAGNLVAPLFGGFAATGALARTATNVRAGARSPLAAVVHALFLLLALLVLAPALGLLPMASLAALLLLVAWNMSHLRHVARMLRKSDRGDKVVLLTCLLLTVFLDMVVAVTVGVVLAALLFLRRMVALTGTTLVTPGGEAAGHAVPEGVLVYRVAGPLFFGAAHKAMAALGRTAAGSVRQVVLDLSAVPLLDATGLVNLESAVARIVRNGARVVLAGAPPGPRARLEREAWARAEGVRLAARVEDALGPP